MTTEEIQAGIVNEIIRARQEQGITQQQLATMSGVKQPVIARIENGVNVPRLSTLIKLLVPLGRKLAVVPLKVDEPGEDICLEYPERFHESVINAL